MENVLVVALLYCCLSITACAECETYVWKRWKCGNNNCIPESYRCDGDNDCGDNSDELNCECETYEWKRWKCGNNNCIRESYRCDGDNDCGDNSDELNCECETYEWKRWKCGNNNCIRESYRCDGDDDCGDNSDELNCATSSPDVYLLTIKDSVDYIIIPKPTPGTTPATSSPGVSLPTTKVSVDYTSPRTQEEKALTIGAIVGGIVAAVVIIVVVVFVVVCVRRKRKQKPAGSALWSRNDTATDNDDLEEHVNPMYVTSYDPNDTHTTDHKLSNIALQISPNGHPAAPPSLDADVYTTVDDEARYVPSSDADRSGGYEDIGFGSNGNTRAPQKDEYAVVDKSRAQKDPVLSANTSASSPAHTTEGSDVYAVVDKSSSRNKAAKNVASGLSDAATSNAGADVYAQVNKSAKKVKVAEPETEGPAYAQVQKPKPAVKHKTSAKPSSDKDVTQRSTADDDEYHTLSHTRGSPHTQGQADLESQYSHIGHN